MSSADFGSLAEFDAFYEGLKASVRADPELSEEVRERRLNYLVGLHFDQGIEQGFFRVVGSAHAENATTSGSVELKREEAP